MELDLSVQAFEWLLMKWGEGENAAADPGFSLESGKLFRMANESAPVLEEAGTPGNQKD